MIKSMTGFGKSVHQENGLSIETEIKSVNSRFLDLSIRLPRNLSKYEFDLKEKIKKKISRGKLYVNISVKNEGIDETLSKIDKNAIKASIEILKEIKELAEIDEEIKLENVLSFQNFFFNDTETDDEKEYKLIVHSVEQALNELELMRAKEGNELSGDLLKRINMIEEKVKEIEKISPESIKEYFDRLKDKAAQLVSDLIDNEDRLMQELAFLSEKYDVTEECVRLKSHVKMFRDTINTEEAAGRRLNFITQEMNREANTINSKTVSSEISKFGISIKEELEKIREQIQNIE